MSISTLANTKWIINSSPNNASVNDTTFALTFSSNGNNYNQLEFFENARENIDIYYGSTGAYVDNVWQNQAYKTIEITGGTDVTNATLIAWFEANAVQQPVATYKTFDLSTLGLATGTHIIQVKARATGYKNSNFSNSVNYTVSSSYNVSIVITSESNHWNSKYWFRVYDGIDANGTLLINDTNNTTQTPMNVVCSSGHLYIELGTAGSLWYVHTPTATSGITLDTSHFDESNPTYDENLSMYICSVLTTVTADGTITFSYIKWED